MDDNFFLIAGPGVIESEEATLRLAERIANITSRLDIPCLFKGACRKANRLQPDSLTCMGDEKVLEMLRKVNEAFGMGTVADIHSVNEAAMAAEYADVLQIPSSLCRQADLLMAAALTGKIVNIRKGRSLSPQDMKHAAEVVVEAGNQNVMLTERGSNFGLQDLVIDYRGIPQMQSMGYPVILDVTSSLQHSIQTGGATGENTSRLIETLANAGIAAGVDGLSLEACEGTSAAHTDGAIMLQLDLLEPLLEKLVRLRNAL